MCFFDQHRFSCGDWEWAHFKQHCDSGLRQNKTCGMKLVMQTVPIGARCDICDQIDARELHRARELDRIRHWRQDGPVMKASIDSSYDTIKVLDSEISALVSERQTRSLSLDGVVNKTRIKDCYPECQPVHETLEFDRPGQKMESPLMTPREEDQPAKTIDIFYPPANVGTESQAKGYPNREAANKALADEAVSSQSAVSGIQRLADAQIFESELEGLNVIDSKSGDDSKLSCTEGDHSTTMESVWDMFCDVPGPRDVPVVVKSGLRNDLECDSDGVSVMSLSESLFSIATGSSQSSVEPLEAFEELLNVLIHDVHLKILFPKALQIMSPDRVERNFSRLLVRYSRDLRREACCFLEKGASRLVRRRAGYLAFQIKQHFISDFQESKQDRVKSHFRMQPLGNRLFIEECSSDESGSDDDGQPIEGFDQVRIFVIGGAPFHELRKNFESFIDRVLHESKSRAGESEFPQEGWLEALFQQHDLASLHCSDRPNRTDSVEEVDYAILSSLPKLSTEPVVLVRKRWSSGKLLAFRGASILPVMVVTYLAIYWALIYLRGDTPPQWNMIENTLNTASNMSPPLFLADGGDTTDQTRAPPYSFMALSRLKGHTNRPEYSEMFFLPTSLDPFQADTDGTTSEADLENIIFGGWISFKMVGDKVTVMSTAERLEASLSTIVFPVYYQIEDYSELLLLQDGIDEVQAADDAGAKFEEVIPSPFKSFRGLYQPIEDTQRLGASGYGEGFVSDHVFQLVSDLLVPKPLNSRLWIFWFVIVFGEALVKVFELWKLLWRKCSRRQHKEILHISISRTNHAWSGHSIPLIFAAVYWTITDSFSVSAVQLHAPRGVYAFEHILSDSTSEYYRIWSSCKLYLLHGGLVVSIADVIRLSLYYALARGTVDALLPFLQRNSISERAEQSCREILSFANFPGLVSSVAGSMFVLANILELTEPPLQSGKKRVRWTCGCGQRLYDDFIELRPGAAREIEQSLNRAMRTRPCRDSQANRPYINLGTRSMSAFRGLVGQNATLTSNIGLPQYSLQSQGRDPGSKVSSSQSDGRWLLVCAKIGRYTTKLSHMDVCATGTDKVLFTQLRKAYTDLRSEWTRLFALRGIKSIRFVQFELHRKELVDIRKVPDMPSGERRKEYLYETCELLPPVGENYMMHLFHQPEDGDDESLTCLRVPKKTREKLKVCQQRGIGVGWGLHLVEGWLLNRIWILILVLFVLGSLVFGICWSIIGHDIQGAFGVSAWMLALAMLIVGTVQAQLD